MSTQETEINIIQKPILCRTLDIPFKNFTTTSSVLEPLIAKKLESHIINNLPDDDPIKYALTHIDEQAQFNFFGHQTTDDRYNFRCFTRPNEGEETYFSAETYDSPAYPLGETSYKDATSKIHQFGVETGKGAPSSPWPMWTFALRGIGKNRTSFVLVYDRSGDDFFQRRYRDALIGYLEIRWS